MTHVSNSSRQHARCEQNMTHVSNASRQHARCEQKEFGTTERPPTTAAVAALAARQSVDEVRVRVCGCCHFLKKFGCGVGVVVQFLALAGSPPQCRACSSRPRPRNRLAEAPLQWSVQPSTGPRTSSPPGRVGVQVGDFGGDNRAGINATLHRISAMRSRTGKIIGACRHCRAPHA
jgi:hypothetical protein